jgi:predicted PurR-regulated permease PerM
MDELSATGDSGAAPVSGPLTVGGVATTVIVAAAVLLVLREGARFAAPILVSVLLAYALEPFVELFRRLRLPGAAAVVMTYLLVLAALVGGARLARRQAVAFLDDLPNTIASIKAAALRRGDDRSAPDRPDTIRNLQRAASHLQKTMEGPAPPPGDHVTRVAVADPFDVRDYLLGMWPRIASTGAQLVVIGVLTFVLLLGGDGIKTKLVELAGPRFERQILTIDVIRVIDRQIQRYLVARLAISVIVAGATAAAMWSIGVRQPLVLGAIAGALNVLPFVGPSVAVAVCTVVAFVQFHNVESTLAAGGAATLVAVLEGNLVTPWLTGRAGELNTVAVYVSVLFWGWMWNVWCLLLAVPIMIAIKAAADHIEPLQPLGELLGR